MKLSILAAVLFAAAGPLALIAGAEQALPRLESTSLRGLDGKDHAVGEGHSGKAAVLIFLGTDCPVSNSYVPAINELAETFAAKGAAVYGIYPDPNLKPGEAAEHAKEYALRTTMLLDPRQTAASALGVTKVPEAVVLSPSGQVLYRGRIDDRWSADGKRRERATKQELTSAIDAALAGKKPDPALTTPFGCPLPQPIPKE
jgi:peroxiredoxin